MLVATGGYPVRPGIPGAESAITSDEAFQLPELPRRVLIVGGGYIAVEFGGIFHGLGARVTIAYRGEQILRGFDEDVRHHLHDELVRKGLDVRLRCDLRSIERRADGSLAATLVTGGEPQQFEVDAVMFATGRQADRNFKRPVRAKAIRVTGHVSSRTLRPAALARQLWPPRDPIGAPRGR